MNFIYSKHLLPYLATGSFLRSEFFSLSSRDSTVVWSAEGIFPTLLVNLYLFHLYFIHVMITVGLIKKACIVNPPVLLDHGLKFQKLWDGLKALKIAFKTIGSRNLIQVALVGFECLNDLPMSVFIWPTVSLNFPPQFKTICLLLNFSLTNIPLDQRLFPPYHFRWFRRDLISLKSPKHVVIWLLFISSSVRELSNWN